MKKIIIFTLLVFGLLVVGCALEPSDAELDTQIEEMSDEELEQIVSEVDDDAAMAGQATRSAALKYKLGYKVIKALYTKKIIELDALKVQLVQLNEFKSGVVDNQTFSCNDPDANVNNGMDRRTTVKKTGSVQGVVDQKTDHCLVEGEESDYYHNLVEYECGADGEIVENTINCFDIGWICNEGACFMS